MLLGAAARDELIFSSSRRRGTIRCATTKSLPNRNNVFPENVSLAPRCHRSFGIRMSSRSSSSSSNSTVSNQPQKHQHQHQQQLAFSPNHRTHLIFGANTDVGKTIVSAGLIRAATTAAATAAAATTSARGLVHYVKPLQCGIGSDATFVRRHAGLLWNEDVELVKEEHHLYHPRLLLTTQVLFQWDTPESPHAASIRERRPCSDAQVLRELYEQLVLQQQQQRTTKTTTTCCYIETAGGVLSPSSASPDNASPRHAQSLLPPLSVDAATASSGSSAATNKNNTTWGWTTQADLYQPLSTYAPVVLVGDGRLGGISATLTALESLLLRGYDVAALVMIEGSNVDQAEHQHHDNLSAIRDYLHRPHWRVRNGAGDAVLTSAASLVSLPAIPSDPSVPLDRWFDVTTADAFRQLHAHLEHGWAGHVADLHQRIRAKGRDDHAVWWPGGPVDDNSNDNDDDDGPVYVDRATGEHLQVVAAAAVTNESPESTDSKQHYYCANLWDASASCWTHGVGHGDATLALTAGAALGRYGHVSGHVWHGPAVTLAQTLTAIMNRPQSGMPPHHNNNNGNNNKVKPWAQRVFYTDSCSSAVEAAIQMGLRTYQQRMQLSEQEFDATDWIVAGQGDCYHGDTLGALNVGEAYVDRAHPWYQSRGLCLAPPTVGFRHGRLVITLPPGLIPDPEVSYEFDSIHHVLDVDTRSMTGKKSLKSIYMEMIDMQWLAHEHSTHRRIGAVLLEPLLLAAGGMTFVDPLWQRAMVEVARSRQIPILWDESTTGLYRLGVASCGREIVWRGGDHDEPDAIICSKLLTGGVVPLSAVVTTDEVYDAVSRRAGQSLANGNAWTAPPVACVCALQALDAYRAVDTASTTTTTKRPNRFLWKGPHLLFSEAATRALSELSWVEQSFTLGSVLTVKLHSKSDNHVEGSDDDVHDNEDDDRGFVRAGLVVNELKARGILAQPFGDVVYIMTSPLAREEDCTQILNVLHEVIDTLSRDESHHS